MDKLIEDFIKDLTPFDITPGAIENVLIQSGVQQGAYVADLNQKQKDLCTAWTYWWCASAPLITGSVEDADSGWSHREGGKQFTAYDKKLYRRMALDLLAKYGIKPLKSTIHVAPGGMRVFPRGK